MNSYHGHLYPENARNTGYFESATDYIFLLGHSGPDGITPLGTIFSLKRPGFFATCAHVAGNKEKGLVLIKNTARRLSDYQDQSSNECIAYPVSIHSTHPFYDLTVIRLEGGSPGDDFTPHLAIGNLDHASIGTPCTTIGFPHLDSGRRILTLQSCELGAKTILSPPPLRVRYGVINLLARQGQSGSPIVNNETKEIIAVLCGAYLPDNGVRVITAGVEVASLHQTTHAVAAEYIEEMY